MIKTKIKIVHVVEGFIGGLATYMCHVLPELSKNGYDVTLICSLHRKEQGMSEKLEALSKAGIAIRYMPMRRGITPLADIYCFWRLYRILKMGQYDIIHTHCSKAGGIGRLAASVAGIKIRLHSSHCFAYLRVGNTLLKQAYYWIERLLGGLTTRYVAVSSSEVSNALKSKLFPEYKITLVENGIPCRKQVTDANDEKMLKADLGIKNGTSIITTGCRFISYKGLELLLETARYVQSDCHFIIAGEGKLSSRLKKYIAWYHLQERVSVLTPNVTMDGLLGISDLAILCSKMEAQPYFLLEAMMSSCPIIATDVPGNRELLEASRGLLVQPDAKGIAEAIDTLLADESLQAYFTDSAYHYAVQNHRLERQITRLSETYLLEIESCNTKEYEIEINARQAPRKKVV